MAFAVGGIAFEDCRMTGPELFGKRASGEINPPYGQFPLLMVDGAPLAQSGAIFRHVAKEGGLYPADAFQAAVADSIVDQIGGEVASAFYSAWYGSPSAEAKEAALKALKEGKLAGLLKGVVSYAAGHKFIMGDELTAPDLVLHAVDGILANAGLAIRELVPELKSVLEAVDTHPKLAAYFENRTKVEEAEKAAAAGSA